ncbi:glutathione synthase [Candidatus Berkiella cookevillensis]|uniref:Glutathione synthetase n=1 Tax=Candidatus Berkiella cookevillensis TaxID=437022 RepID=A0A0Q9YSS0_9GAMM|nr:glutathione synthase [Candidatus Berkiella cookevillensis]MCS5708517.1 glutathione synthase [Candidatus Berkiella cookevillensis]
MKILFIIDPIESLNLYKDTSFAFMLEAQHRKYEIYYCEQRHLYYHQEDVLADVFRITVKNAPEEAIHCIQEEKDFSLSSFDVILMRKDPPFNLQYIYTTYLLEIVEKKGVLIVNRPQSLRDCNEKIFALTFPHCTPALMVSSQKAKLQDFIQRQSQCVLKPLDGMGGREIFLSNASDLNLSVIIETLTKNETTPIMVQQFVPEITEGDKRILLINGYPIDYALARIPPKGEIRGNLAAGGSGIAVALTDRDRWICEQIGPTLREKGLHFVGIDVIGNYLTEINVTSPTCVREIDKAFNLNISALFWDHVVEQLN